MKGTAYLIQATLIAIWWICLLLNQAFYDAFQFPGIGTIAFNSFLIPDIMIIALLSLVRAYKEEKALDYIILGGFGFATLYCVNATILTKGGFLATTAMLLGWCYNLFLISESRLFRQSNTNDIIANISKTILQIVCVWTITLLVFPVLIMKSFGEPLSIQGNFKMIGLILFLCFSMLGIYSAFVMVRFGKGTPLPLDQTQQLVVTGPYQYVRNLMAIAGIGQGISVSILYGSIPVLIYILIGALLWQIVVRPIEERNMQQRFGKEYETYRNKVKCWLPTFK